jgi:SpoVK/Ycf46/Vps4 family AAA+-type ATPase
MGDRDLLRRTVEAVIAEERNKQHHVLADRLQDALRENGSMASAGIQQRPSQSAPALMETHPSGRSLSELVLAQETREICQEIVEEQHRSELLQAHNLEPRHRILLAGPPGNGKTALADALAFELAVPFLVVRYEALIASFLGETSARLQRVFEYAHTRHCVLFFDEFDTLGKERGDTHETGEIKRVVSSLLLQIDALPSYVVVVVATNHPELLDRAVWRRFQVRLQLPRPTPAQREEWFARMHDRGALIGLSPKSLAARFPSANFSELEDFTLDLQRRLVLNGSNTSPSRLATRLLAQRRRMYTAKGSQQVNG